MSVTGSLMCLRINAMSSATATPIATPPAAAQTKSRVIRPRLTVPATATIAVRSATSAVASFSSDSPSSTVTMPRGSPMRRAMAVAATASGGATTAPNATAAANGMGSSSQATRPTVNVVKITSPTARKPIARRLAEMSTRDVRMAAAYNNGGSNPISTRSGLSCTGSTNGR